MTRILLLVYDPRNWREARPIPVDWRECTRRTYYSKAKELLEWPDAHVVLKRSLDVAGTCTEDTIAGLRIEVESREESLQYDGDGDHY